MSASPREDYDPLYESVQRDTTPPWGCEPGSDGDSDRIISLDASDLKDVQLYCITPPTKVTCRIAKREKMRSVTKSKEQKEKKRQQQRSMKDESKMVCDILSDSPVDSGIDKSDSLRKHLTSGRRSKTRDKTRSFERDCKSSGDETISRVEVLHIHDGGDSDRLTSRQAAAKSVQSAWLSVTFDGLISQSMPVVPKSRSMFRPLPLRQPSVSRQECPPDRLEFYKNFSLLINLGSKGLKEREEKFKRQKSEEDEILQSRLRDEIWLELAAWHAGRSLRDYEHVLTSQRERAQAVLEEVKQFCLGGAGEQPMADQEEASSVMQLLTDPLLLSDTYVTRFYNAIRRVHDQTERVEAVAALFPTTRAMHKHYDVCTTREFQLRLSAMQTWLNSANELNNVITTMAKICGLDKMDIHCPFLSRGAKGNSSPTPTVARVSGTNTLATATEAKYIGAAASPASTVNFVIELDDSELGSDGKKSVHFDVDSPPLTPESDVRPPFQSMGSSALAVPGFVDNRRTGGMTVATSLGAIVVPPSHTGIYRPFIDTMLRKMSLGALFDKYAARFLGAYVKAFHSIALLEASPSEASHAAFIMHLPLLGEAVNLPLLPRHVVRQMSAILASQRESDAAAATVPVADGTGLVEATAAAAGRYYEQYSAMQLVSLKPAFVFLLRMPLDMTHECLRLRLEQRVEPSLLSIRQVTCECQEALTLAVQVKLMYHDFVRPVLSMLQEGEDKLEGYMDEYNADVKEMLEVYFCYLQHWMLELQKQKQATSASMKSILEEGWAYSKRVCPYILGGVVEAGRRFCGMASSLLNSIRDSLDNDVDDAVNEYSDSLFRGGSSIGDPTSDSPPLSSSPTDSEDVCTDVDYRHYLLQTCRGIKNLFRETRERAAKALGFAKMLRKDLEIAADFNVIGSTEKLLSELRKTNHFRVIVPQKANYLIFVPSYISESSARILALLNVTSGREDVSTDPVMPDGDSTHADDCAGEGYLILVRFNPTALCPLWDGLEVRLAPSADTAIALSHIDVNGLLLVVGHSGELATRRREFVACVPDYVELVDEQTSCHQAIAESLEELKCTALELSDAIHATVRLVEDKLFTLDLSGMEDGERSSITTICRETMHQCYNFGFEYLQELTRIVTSSAESRRKLNKNLLRFAGAWMQFVTQKCERGRGTRPRWANQGMDFLIVASDPKILMVLEAAEFEGLKEQINRCVSHIIGDKSLAAAGGILLASRSISGGSNFSESGLSTRLRPITRRNVSCPVDSPRPPYSRRSTVSDPGTPGGSSSRGSRDSLLSVPSRPPIDENGDELPWTPDGSFRDALSYVVASIEDNTPSARIRKAIDGVEFKRNAKLYDRRFIGRVTERPHEIDYHIGVRRVNFKWQRGIKLGEGQFGKVYSAVNVDTGELMAMKELGFQPNDLQTIKEIADELKIFESIQHPSLVKYYGVEVHRDEMFIFMEYCDCGTLEEAAKVGLTEAMIRQYTGKLLVAINVLHEHNIVHRDIKGANIFLLSNGILKLGDFGCSVQLKDKTTMVGEINSVIGTAAFMAPEVITHKREGHGRAADIWSLGCVVVEMATGKRPWHELENSYQIMFKVGMGGVPNIPESLSSEGRDFLSHCFTHDPQLRWTASQLQTHSFTKVDADS